MKRLYNISDEELAAYLEEQIKEESVCFSMICSSSDDYNSIKGCVSDSISCCDSFEYEQNEEVLEVSRQAMHYFHSEHHGRISSRGGMSARSSLRMFSQSISKRFLFAQISDDEKDEDKSDEKDKEPF